MMDRSVYDIHVPHDREDLREGHVDANLSVISCDYLGSSNYGVLSSCVDRSRPLRWQLYLLLSRLSKLGFFFERRFGRLPATKFFSPYVVAVAERH